MGGRLGPPSLVAEVAFCSVSASAGNRGAMGDPRTQEGTGASSSTDRPPTVGGVVPAPQPTAAEARWAGLVRQLRLLFRCRRYWAGMGQYLKNFTALR